MATIFIASKDVFQVGEHSYWVFDPDDNPYNLNERIIRGGDTNVNTFSPYLMEIDRSITNSRDTLHEYDSNGSIIATLDPYMDRNYTTVVSGTLNEVESIWNTMVSEAKTFGALTTDPWTNSEGGHISSGTEAYILPENSYSLFTTNCNCFTNTVGFSVDIDFENHVPLDGGDLGSGNPISIIQYTGYQNIFISQFDDVVLITNRNNASYDQGGNDTYIYDVVNTNTSETLKVFEDTNANTLDRIVLTNVNAEDVKFAKNADGDLYVFYGSNDYASILIEDQFDESFPKINTIWVYQNNGEGPVVLSLNNASDFIDIIEDEFGVGLNQQASNDWIEGTLQANGSAQYVNELVQELEEAIELNIIEGQIINSESYPVLFTDENGQTFELNLNPAERKLLNYDLRIADFAANGAVISQTSGTQTLYGESFNFTETVLELNGEQQRVTEFALASGSNTPANGVQSQTFYAEKNATGQFYVSKEETQFIDSAGRTHDTIEYRESEDGNWMVRETIDDPVLGASSESPLYIVPSTDLLQTLQFSGGTVGSLLGGHLADDSAYKAVVYSAFFKTVGEHFGTFASYVAVNNNWADSIDVALNGGTIQGTDFENQAFADSFVENLQASVSSALAGAIVDEVGDALGIEGTIVGEVFDVTATTVTTGVISGGIDILFNNLDGSAYGQILNAGFDFDEVITVNGQEVTVGDYVQAQVINAIAAYAGNRLASELIEPNSEAAALFGAAGSAFGTAIGSGSIGLSTAQSILGASFAGGPVGVAIGAFIGTIAGTAFGNVFGDDSEPSAWAHLGYDYNNNEYEIRYNNAHDGGDPTVSSSMAQQVANGINSIVDATYGILRSGMKAPQIRIGYEGDDFLVAVGAGEWKSFSAAADAIMYGAFKAMKEFDLVGGHAVMMRAWHSTDAENLHELREDLETAEAFQNYLANPGGIIALMMDDPDSDLAQSWAAILQRATELELHLPHEKDLDGGWGEVLLAQGLDPELIPELSGETITLTDPNTGEQTTLHHIIGPGYEIIRIEGTDGDDIIEVIVDGPSITYVDAGAGNDIVQGSEQADVIYGNTGDDTLNGLGGNDWLHGGAGNDTLDGGAGDDLVIGGDDNDLLQGGDDTDHIHGNAGDDILIGMGGQDFLYGGLGNDILHSDNEQRDYLYGGEGDDTLHATYDDILQGGEGNDIFVMRAGAGNNSIVIQRDNGHDTITADANAGSSWLIFDGDIGGNELFFQQSGDDLKILVLGEDQSVTVQNYFTGALPLFLRVRGNTYQADAYQNTFQTITQLVAIDFALSQQPIGQHNYLSDTVLAERDYVWEDYWSKVENNSTPIEHGSNADDQHLFSAEPSSRAIYGRAGDDFITSHQNNLLLHDTLYGDSGDDVIRSGWGEDLLVGGLGDDELDGGRHDDKLYGGFGEDHLIGGTGNDDLYGGLDNDLLEGDGGDDFLSGGDGNDILNDSLGNNILSGGDGNDILDASSNASSNTFYGGAGDDVITGGDGINTVFGGNGTDTIVSGASDDWLNGGSGGDIISASDGDDVVEGGEGNDQLNGDGGDDQISGGTGDDEISGGAGEDQLFGGAGDDVYVYGPTDKSHDLILDSTGNDTIKFAAGTTIGDLVFSRDQYDLEIIGSYNITVKDHFYLNTDNAVETLLFDDGSTFDLSSLVLDSVTNAPESRSDYFQTEPQNAVLGNVLVDNGNGLDFDLDGDILTVVQASITTVNNGVVEVFTNGDFSYTPDLNFSGVDEFNYILEDGFGGRDVGLVSLIVTNPPIAQDDDFVGGKDQALTANVLSDNGNGMDADLNTSDVISVLEETKTTAQGGMIEILENGDFTYSPPSGYTGNDSFTYTLLDNHGALDTALVTINVQVTGPTLYSGTTGNDTLNGSAATDHFDSLAGDDVVTGDAGNDLFIYRDGYDIYDGGADEDTVDFSNLTYAIWANLDYNGVEVQTHYTNSAQNGGDQTPWYLVGELENFENVIGTDFKDNIFGESGSNQLHGGAGNDWLHGGAGGDFLYGGAGNDDLYGEEGNDIFFYQDGNDFYNGGSGTDLVDYSNFNYAVYVKLDAQNEEAWTRYETHLDSGSWVIIGDIVNVENIQASIFDDKLWGDGSDNRMYGNDGDDIIYGRSGNDILYGGFGVDTLYGESGSDVFVFENASAFNGIDIVHDFDIAEGDAINIADVLFGYDPLNDIISDFVQITDDGADSILSVDADGGADNFVQVATLKNVNGLSDEQTLEANGNLITI